MGDELICNYLRDLDIFRNVSGIKVSGGSSLNRRSFLKISSAAVATAALLKTEARADSIDLKSESMPTVDQSSLDTPTFRYLFGTFHERMEADSPTEKVLKANATPTLFNLGVGLGGGCHSSVTRRHISPKNRVTNLSPYEVEDLEYARTGPVRVRSVSLILCSAILCGSASMNGLVGSLVSRSAQRLARIFHQSSSREW